MGALLLEANCMSIMWTCGCEENLVLCQVCWPISINKSFEVGRQSLVSLLILWTSTCALTKKKSRCRRRQKQDDSGHHPLHWWTVWFPIWCPLLLYIECDSRLVCISYLCFKVNKGERKLCRKENVWTSRKFITTKVSRPQRSVRQRRSVGELSQPSRQNVVLDIRRGGQRPPS